MSASEDIQFDCPGCRQRLSVPASAAGKVAECPACKRRCEVPQTSVTSEAPAPLARPTHDSAEQDEPRRRDDYDLPRRRDDYDEPRRDDHDEHRRRDDYDAYDIRRSERQRSASGTKATAPAIAMIVVA
jgi:hypothetical protein